ncbi:MAG TPA: glycosyltransferase [Ruminiclostridium sp.]
MAITPHISIIVPVNNMESYLSRCILSILKQSYTNFELLLIDDGSTDKSAKICDEYALIDNRVKAIHQSNQGVSDARNHGIRDSKGKYICFIDADDYIEKTMLESLLSGFDLDVCQLTICGFQCEYENGSHIYNTKKVNNFIFNTDSAICSLFEDKLYRYQGYIWNKLFILDTINEFKISFHPNIYYNEDRLFCFEYIKHCNKVCYSTSIQYHHIFSDTSAMSSIKTNDCFNKKYITDLDAFRIMATEINNFNNITKTFFWYRNIDSVFRIYSLMSEYKCIDSKFKNQAKQIVSKGVTYATIRYIGIRSYILNLSFVISPSVYQSSLWLINKALALNELLRIKGHHIALFMKK